MSAPSIPNLNDLRRGGPRLRGRGRGDASDHHGTGASTTSQAMVRDGLIRATDNDASTSRLSAVAAGYLDDPFAHLLHTSSSPSPRRLPVMNRGTYVRTTALDRLVDTFIDSHPGQRVQIISLGAGSDTRYFRLLRRQHQRKDSHRAIDLLYHELDLPENAATKIEHLRKPEFADAVKRECGLDWTYDLRGPSSTPSLPAQTTPSPITDPRSQPQPITQSLHTDLYTLTPFDLRTLQTPSITPLPLPQISPTTPTLILSECCLCYLPPQTVSEILNVFTTHLIPTPTPLSIAIYEPIRPHDAFGRTMVANLTQRGISLPTLERWPDLDAQRARLVSLGSTSQRHNVDTTTVESSQREKEIPTVDRSQMQWQARAVDLDFVWRKWAALEERERVEKCEWLDEIEEFVLLGKHYCIAWGWRGYDEEGGKGGWQDVPA
jgi:[phosphatase 2A protein]-leucine-carboxy methyltransferase